MKFLEAHNLVSGFVPVDMQTAANAGDYVSLKNYRHVSVVLFKAAGTAGDDPVLTFEQASDVSGTGVKNLATIDEYWYKQGTLTAVGSWTRATQTAAATVTLNATSAESQGIYVFEIESSELDVANSFDCVRVSVADVGGNAQLGAMLYILSEPRHGAAPTDMASAIVD